MIGNRARGSKAGARGDNDGSVSRQASSRLSSWAKWEVREREPPAQSKDPYNDHEFW